MAMSFDSVQDELIALAELGVKKALAGGAEEAEAFLSWLDTISINIKKAIVEARRGVASGIGIRVVSNGKVGFAATSGIDKSQIQSVANEAIAVARIRPPDPSFKHLPDALQRPSKDGIIDDAVIKFSEKDALEAVNLLAKTALAYDERIKSLFGGVEVQRGVHAVANSRGISDFAKSAGIGGGVYCVAVEQGKQKTGSEEIVSRKLEDFSETGKMAAERAIKMLGAKPLRKSMKTTTVWENVSIATLLKGMLNTASNAQNVQEGKSFFKGKIGEKVACNTLTIVDDGQLPEGISTTKIDAEGVPTQTTTLIEKGVLKAHLYDSYAALRERKESTGNAKRQWPEPFLSTPTVSTTNLVVNPGSKKLKELIAGVEEGVLITDMVMGTGHANMITGEFSVVAPSAFLIKDGDVTNPLESVTIAGNFFHALKKIREIGCDVHLLTVGKIPSMIFEDLTVSG